MLFLNPTPGHDKITVEYENTATCSCGFTRRCERFNEAHDAAGQHYASTRWPKSAAALPPMPAVPTVPAVQVPPGLDASEALNYRRGYSAAHAKYLKDNGTPAVEGTDRVKLREHAAAWYREHNEPRAAAAHRAGISAVRAYWKRHGITDRGHLVGTVRAVRKPKQTTCEHCGQLTAVA